jgi:hypothetical protein
MLPDFAAARVSSNLEAIEQVVDGFEQCRREHGTNNEGAAASVRTDVEYTSAVRWVGRRRRWVRVALAIVIGLVPEVFAGCEPTLASVRSRLGGECVLVRLREIAAAHIARMPAPLGFAPLPKAQRRRRRGIPHTSGCDPPTSTQ